MTLLMDQKNSINDIAIPSPHISHSQASTSHVTNLSVASKNEPPNSKATSPSKTLKTSKSSGPVPTPVPTLIIRYGKGNYFRAHFDWFDPDRDQTLDQSGNRATSFFVYLVADCEGGTTIFPNVLRPEGEEWCDLLKCRNENGTETEVFEVKATVGTAIFWQNFNSEGGLDRGTLHAGTDVFGGTKVGLNIWTREKKYRW